MSAPPYFESRRPPGLPTGAVIFLIFLLVAGAATIISFNIHEGLKLELKEKTEGHHLQDDEITARITGTRTCGVRQT